MTSIQAGDGNDRVRPLVLVVDDEEPIRKALDRHLKKLGYDVIVTGDGEQAVELARSHRPAVILSDIYMPGIDGHALLAKLNRIGSLAAVVLMSGQGELDDAISAMREGAVDYLKKPWTPEGLAAVLTRAMGLAEALQELAEPSVAGRALGSPTGAGETDRAPDVADVIERLTSLSDADLPLAEEAPSLEPARFRDAFPTRTPALKTLSDRIWRFSVARAIAMQELAEIADAELALPPLLYFQAGLLLDAGASYLLSAADRALSDGQARVGDPVKLLAVMTAHHAALTARIIRRWNLPAALEQLAADHHRAVGADSGRRAAEPMWCAAELGGAMAVRVTGFGDPTGDRLLSPDRLARCAYTLGVGDTSLRRLTRSLTERATQTWAAFD